LIHDPYRLPLQHFIVPSFHQLITPSLLPDREFPVIATPPLLDIAPLRGIGHLPLATANTVAQ